MCRFVSNRVAGFGEVDRVSNINGGRIHLAILAARLSLDVFVMPSPVRLKLRSNSLEPIRLSHLRA